VGQRALVVIASYGLTELTRTAVADVLRERSLARVLVVDNRGDYCAVDDEEIMRPPDNIGWLRASNEGIRAALRNGVETVILLNNDTRLSDGCIEGLLAAQDAGPSGVIAPLYDDDAFAAQHHDLTGPLASFQPRAEEFDASIVDGTCVLIPTALARVVGEFDERRFGMHGWGGIDDYCIRARRLGFRVAITRRSFVQHFRGSTAAAAGARYEHFARSELLVGMALKYGPRWWENFDQGVFVPVTPGELLTATARYVQDRLGLAAVEWRSLVPNGLRRHGE
jgi:GT2 family glycosyltransferase